jgi:hypothetical protein
MFNTIRLLTLMQKIINSLTCVNDLIKVMTNYHTVVANYCKIFAQRLPHITFAGYHAQYIA